MLEEVAHRKNMTGAVAEAWVEAVRDKFAEVGVVTLRDFIVNVLVINKRLHAAEYSVLHRTTLNMMLSEVAEMMYGPQE
jgi:hypothetical protein